MRLCVVCKAKAPSPRLSPDICPDCWREPFPITSVCRGDLAEFFTPQQIASIDMAYLARKMADAYCDQVFWIDLKILAEAQLEAAGDS
jgi:hypothetical protein